MLSRKLSVERKRTINATNLLLLATLNFLGKWICVLLVICLGKSWFAIEEAANIMAQVVSTNTKLLLFGKTKRILKYSMKK